MTVGVVELAGPVAATYARTGTAVAFIIPELPGERAEALFIAMAAFVPTAGRTSSHVNCQQPTGAIGNICEGTNMREQFSCSVMRDAIAAMGVGAVIFVCIAPARAQAPVVSATAPTAALKTPWGEPDLQGIWTEETDTPLQRPAKYADQEFFTAAQRVELDIQRGALAGKDQRAERGTEAVRSARAGERVMASIRHFLERRMRLKVNEEKSGIRQPHQVHFLGFRFQCRQTAEGWHTSCCRRKRSGG
jgi:hypothetical protein